MEGHGAPVSVYLDTPNSLYPSPAVRKIGGSEISRFGQSKIKLLQRFLPFANGAPAHDHVRDIFATLDAEAFQRCVIASGAEATSCPAAVIAFDGKTSRRSYHKEGRQGADPHDLGLRRPAAAGLGQIKANEKSNEITAIPALIEMIEIEGAVISVDAMGRRAPSRRKSWARRKTKPGKTPLRCRLRGRIERCRNVGAAAIGA